MKAIIQEKAGDLEAAEAAAAAEAISVDGEDDPPASTSKPTKIKRSAMEDDAILAALEKRSKESSDVLEALKNHLATSEPVTERSSFSTYLLQIFKSMSDHDFKKVRGKINKLIAPYIEIDSTDEDEDMPTAHARVTHTSNRRAVSAGAVL